MIEASAEFDAAAARLSEHTTRAVPWLWEVRGLDEFVTNARAQLPPAVDLVGQMLRAYADDVVAGKAPATLPRPEPKAAEATPSVQPLHRGPDGVLKVGPPGWELHRITTRIDRWVVADPHDEGRIPAVIAEMMRAPCRNRLRSRSLKRACNPVRMPTSARARSRSMSNRSPVDEPDNVLAVALGGAKAAACVDGSDAMGSGLQSDEDKLDE